MPQQKKTPPEPQPPDRSGQYDFTLNFGSSSVPGGLGSDMLWRRRRQVEGSRQHLFLFIAVLALLALGGILYEYAF